MAEMDASIALIQRVLLLLPDGPDSRGLQRAPWRPRDWAGPSDRAARCFTLSISTIDGKLARVKIKSPSFSNWRAFPFTVHGSNMMDYAINEASFGLTIAGCDR